MRRICLSWKDKPIDEIMALDFTKVDSEAWLGHP